MINYKHLHYFWVVAKEGGVGKAAERLHLTPQTISGQLGILEDQLGKALFRRVGRGLELTAAGRLVKSYADEIFSLGGELQEAVNNLPLQRLQVFKVGVADVVPKSIAYALLAPAMDTPDAIRIVCSEGGLTSLLADLAVHQVDLVIADSPIPSGVSVRGFSHFLGDSGITFLATKEIAQRLNGSFPDCLDGVEMLLPGEASTTRSQLMLWLENQRIHPKIVGEFDDSALMKAFGRAGVGVFVSPTAIAEEVQQQYEVVAIGQTDEVKESFYAISVEKKISHPAVAAVTKAARDWLTTE